MTDELREVYNNLTFDDACCIIREKLGNMAANYVAIGFFLRRAKEQELYKAGGYESIHDMAKTEFGMARQTTDHCMNVNRKFSKDGDSPMLAEQYRGFSKSQLQEMLYLTDEQLETVVPEMTVKEIRNVRKDSEPDEEPKVKVELQKPSREQEEKEKCSTSSMEPEKDKIVDWKERCQKGECPPHVPACTRMEWGTSPEQQLAGCKECESCWAKWQKQQEILQRAESKEEPAVREEQEGDTGHIHSQDGMGKERDIPKIEEPQQESTYLNGESEIVIDGKYREVKENAEEKYTVRYFLEEQKGKLDNLLWSAKLRDRELLASEEKTIKRQKMIVAALANMVTELELEELRQQIQAEQRQPELPVMKNNDQRKAWLANYKVWGLWYEDDHIGVKYYKYDFENGARLIAEVYENLESFSSAYLHLVGGPEPPKGAYGIGKWTRHERYSRHPNSDTELVEFLKELQKGAKA